MNSRQASGRQESHPGVTSWISLLPRPTRRLSTERLSLNSTAGSMMKWRCSPRDCVLRSGRMESENTPPKARLRGAIVDRPTVVPITVEDMPVHGLAFLSVDLTRIFVRQPVQRQLDSHADSGPGLLLLAPIEDQLFALEDL